MTDFRLEDKDVRLFDSLATTQVGQALEEYLVRLTNFLLDVRNIKDPGGEISAGRVEGAIFAGNAIQDHLIGRIRMARATLPGAKAEQNEYV